MRTIEDHAEFEDLVEGGTMPPRRRSVLKAALDDLKCLITFYEMSAKSLCVGDCGRAQPILQDSKYGQRSSVSGWVCAECHKRLCGEELMNAHSCKVLD
jgi:hypothetical protein